MALPPIYDPEAVAPMWQELAAVGVEPLTTPEQVDQLLGAGCGSALVIVNSVCGCAAGQARPGAMLALQNSVISAVVTLHGPLQRRQAGVHAPAHRPSADERAAGLPGSQEGLRRALHQARPLDRPGEVQTDPAAPRLRLADSVDGWALLGPEQTAGPLGSTYHGMCFRFSTSSVASVSVKRRPRHAPASSCAMTWWPPAASFAP